jgi:DNA-binding IclR family transcriptional regulator
MRDRHIDKATAGVGLLSKAFQVLDQFTPDKPMWTQAELGLATGVSKSTINRLVRYFCDRGYLMQLEKKGPYGLGPAAIDLGQRASTQFDIGAVAMPILERLVQETQETALVASYQVGRREVVCVAQIPSPHEGLRVFQSVGSAIPLHAGAVAKAVLAYLPADIQSSIIAGPLEKMTDQTITDPAVLAHDLQDVRARGYSVSRDETYYGVYGIGAPVYGPGNVVVAGIAIAAPKNRMESADLLIHAQKVIAVAAALSTELGASRAAA